METSITAANANRRFSEVLRRVEHGASVAVTRHGRTVARIVPATDDVAQQQSRAARLNAYLRRAAERPAIDIGRWSRDELYDR